MSTEDNKPAPLFSSSEEVLHRKVEVNADGEISSILSLSPEEKLDFYEVDETADWIKKNNFDRVALQIPDDLMRDSIFVSNELEKRTNVKPFILADTSYGSCCVDEIAAQHASANCLVHYGDACLSEPPEKLPVRFVFGKTAIDLEDYRSKLTSLVGKDSEKQMTKICLLYDSSLSHCSEEISRTTREVLGEGVFDCGLIAPSDREENKEKNCSSSLSRRTPIDMDSWPEATVAYVGTGTTPLLPLFLMSHPNCSRVVQYNPLHKTITSDTPTAVRQLRRRLFLIEKVKDANTVGIVCGSLGVRGHRTAVDRVKRLCQLAHKKAYVFSVGKLNVPKLANFAAEIDIFVLVSCPFGTMLDTTDHYRPIVSAFEAEIAFNASHQWHAGAGWTAEFAKLISEELPGEQEDVPDVSLVTGKVRAVRLEDSLSESGNRQVQVYSAGTFHYIWRYCLRSIFHLATSDYFEGRSWKGLVETYEDQPVELASQGRSGIASAYESEPVKKS